MVVVRNIDFENLLLTLLVGQFQSSNVMSKSPPPSYIPGLLSIQCPLGGIGSFITAAIFPATALSSACIPLSSFETNLILLAGPVHQAVSL